MPLDKASRRILVAIAATGLLLRLGVRLYRGATDFWQGYAFHFVLAQHIAAGHGFTFDGHAPTTFRVPGYPVFLAAVALGHQAFFAIAVAQSFVGAGTVVCAGLLAEELFGPTEAIVVAVLTALYPYYVVHDTGLQETSLFTFLTALCMWLLIRAHRRHSGPLAAAAGVALAADVLTRATMAPVAAVAPVWLVLAGGRQGKRPMRVALWCGGALVIGILPWLVRSYALTGSVGLSTETGAQFWAGNNAQTFTYYPADSIDRSADAALNALSVREKAELDAMGSDDISIDRWFFRSGLAFVRAHPGLTAWNAWRKVQAAFSWVPTPRHGLWWTVMYAASYGPIMTLGVIGMVLTRRSWREQALIYAAFLSTAVLTAAFFGHTSHRSHLDVYWIVYSAHVLTVWAPSWARDIMATRARGFASMDRNKQRETSRGGKAAHQKGTAHEWTKDEAREAGRKGGIVSHRHGQKAER